MGLFDTITNFFGGGLPDEGDPFSDRDAFARMLMDEANDAGAPALAYDSDEYCLRTEDGQIHWLDNHHAEYLTLDEVDRQAAIATWVGLMTEAQTDIPELWPEAAAGVLPRVRGRAYVQLTRLQLLLLGKDVPAIAYHPVCEHLIATPVFDTPHAMTSISERQIAEWGVDLPGVVETAMANLRARELPVAVATIEPGLRLLRVGDDYDSSRMLLPELIAAMDLPGDPVVLPFARDRVFAAGSRDADSLRRMLDLTEEMLEDQRIDTLRPAVFRQGRWETWSPDPEHDGYEAWLHRLRYADLVEYTQQKELLDEWNERMSIDQFVASYQLFTSDDGTSVSVSVLSPIPTLLPRTDMVFVFGPDERSRVQVPWAHFQACCSDALSAVHEHWPVRYHIEGPPTQAMWAKLIEGHEVMAD